MSFLRKAVGYIRCSTEMQEDSPDQQKKEILAFAAKMGYEIIEWFVDFGKSGTTFDQRPEFQRLRRIVENGRTFSFVICYDESRWGRSIMPEENAYWRVHFEKCGVKVILVKTSVDPENRFAPLMKALEGVQATDYVEKLSDVTLRGAKNNIGHSNGGTAPFGYQRLAVNIKTGNTRLLKAGDWCVKGQEKVTYTLGAKEEIEIVKYIFEQRAAGVACVLIAGALNQKTLSCAQRGRWKELDQKWSSGTIRSIIQNHAYYGAYTYNRFSTSKIIAAKKGRHVNPLAKAPAWPNPREEWVYKEGAYPPIVAKELWEKANTVRKNRSSSKPNQHSYRSRYLLSGIIRCSKCGFPFQGWSGKVRGKEYLRYIDGGYQSKRACEFLSIPKDEMDDFAIKAIKETLSEPDMVTRIEERLREMLKDNTNTGPSLSSLQNELNEVKRKTENLLRLAEEGNLESESIGSRLKELDQVKREILNKISGLNSPIPAPAILNASQEVAKFLLNFEEAFARAPIEERKILVKKCISGIVVDREARVARFYVRRIPAVTPIIEEVENRGGFSENVMSGLRARNRT